MVTRQWLIVGGVVLLSVAGVSAAFGQSVSSGTIEGTVKDESSSVLPGATVTLTSPQLQVGQLVQVSDAAGAYKFVDLPAGTYRLKAELAGFSAMVRDDLRLTVGFNARVDISLKLGALEEAGDRRPHPGPLLFSRPLRIRRRRSQRQIAVGEGRRVLHTTEPLGR